MHVYVPESTGADWLIGGEIFAPLKCSDLFIVYRAYDQSAWRLHATRSLHLPRRLLITLSSCHCSADARLTF